MSDLFEKHLTKEKLLFRSTIIINKKYSKYRSIRGVAFVLFLIAATPAIYMSNSADGRQDLIWGATNEDSPFFFYYVVLIILTVIYGTIHFYTWRQKVTGEFIITNKTLVIKNNEQYYSYSLDDLESLILSRGSSYHVEDHIGKPYDGDNHIIYTVKNKEKEKLEFRINDVNHNLEFVDLVSFLRNNLQSKFKFFSI